MPRACACSRAWGPEMARSPSGRSKASSHGKSPGGKVSTSVGWSSPRPSRLSRRISSSVVKRTLSSPAGMPRSANAARRAASSASVGSPRPESSRTWTRCGLGGSIGGRRGAAPAARQGRGGEALEQGTFRKVSEEELCSTRRFRDFAFGMSVVHCWKEGRAIAPKLRLAYCFEMRRRRSLRRLSLGFS
jgi:hypothetical protein